MAKISSVTKTSKFKSVAKMFKAELRDFSTFSSLHGPRNLIYSFDYFDRQSDAKGNSHKMAKTISLIIWVGSVLGGIFVAAIMMRLVWIRFQSTPTIVSVESYYYPIYNVPFPSITLCNVNKVYGPSTIALRHKLREKNVDDRAIDDFFREISALVRPKHYEMTNNVMRVWKILEAMNYTTARILYDSRQPCDILVRNCTWMNRPFDCMQYFERIQTSKGFCCSFHYKALDNFKKVINDQYADTKTESRSFRLSGSGDDVGLEFLVYSEPQYYVSPSNSLLGVKLIIQKPDDFIDMPSNVYIVQPGYRNKIYVTPSVYVTDETVRTLSLKQRDCLFEDENTLQFTTKYSYWQCISECRMQTVLKICKCIPFYYPHQYLPSYKDVKQCGFNELNCMRKIRSLTGSLQPPPNTTGFEDGEEIGMRCNCWPECFDTQYESQLLISNYLKSPLLTANMDNITRAEFLNSTTISISYKDFTCRKYRRSMFLTWDGLFAAFGGIFGLCLGGSIISLIEIVYFIVIRILFGAIPEKSANNLVPKIITIGSMHQSQPKDVFSITKTNLSRKLGAHHYEYLP